MLGLIDCRTIISFRLLNELDFYFPVVNKRKAVESAVLLFLVLVLFKLAGK